MMGANRTAFGRYTGGDTAFGEPTALAAALNREPHTVYGWECQFGYPVTRRATSAQAKCGMASSVKSWIPPVRGKSAKRICMCPTPSAAHASICAITWAGVPTSDASGPV
jgi:hypothetical protein